MSRFTIGFLTGFFILFSGIISCSDKKDTNRFEISGKLDNVTDDYFYMIHEFGDSLSIDTIPINSGGEFSYTGAVDTLTEMTLYFNQNTKSTYVLVDKGWKIELKGNMQYPDLIEVKGGNVNDDLTKFKQENKELLKSRTDILNAAEEQGEDSLTMKDYMADLKNVNFELSNVAAEYIKANPEKISSVMLISFFFKDENTIPRLDENLSLLQGKALDFPLTEDLKTYRDKVKLSAVGSYAPSIVTKNFKDKSFNLRDYRGKYVLISFVSTTCKACWAAKKDYVKVYNDFKKQKKNIEFLSIVKDIEENALSKNITDSVKWEILPVNGGWSSSIFNSYYIHKIPYNILVSPSGTILERDISVLSLPQKIDELTRDKN